MAYKIDGNVQDQDFTIRQEDLQGSDLALLRNERNVNDGDNQEITYQADYAHPIGDKVKIESGAKMVLRNVTSDFQYDLFNPTSGEFEVDEANTDFLDYDQDVYAGYVSSTFKLGDKYGLIAGARYEFTEYRDASGIMM